MNIELVGVSRSFGRNRAVDGVSLELQQGEVHAVNGTNGAGKSTLINMLSGEIRASDGRIRLDGEDLLETLKRQGALEVSGWIVARTPAPGDT